MVLGFLELDNETTYNTCILIDPDGDIIGKYSKTHFAQGYTINPSCYVPGEQYPVFQTPFGKIGMMICYDGFFPEVSRELSNRGAEVIAADEIWACTTCGACEEACPVLIEVRDLDPGAGDDFTGSGP